MLLHRRPALTVEALEDRHTPSATLRFANGSLFITGDNTANTVALTGQAGAVTVTVNSQSLGTYALTGNVTVFLGTANDTVNVSITGGGSLPGDLTVYAGNGNDTVSIDGAGEGTGTIAGRVTLSMGSGDDEVDVAQTGAVQLSGLVQIDGGLGDDLVRIGSFNAGATVSGFMSLTRVNSFFTEAPTAGGTVLAGVAMNDSSESSGIVFIPDSTTFNGDVVVVGNSGDDVFEPFLDVVFNGRLTMIGNGGNDLYFPAGSNVFNSDVTFIGDSGNDTMLMGETDNGNVTLLLGDGNNVVSDFGGWTVGGNLTIRAGSGNDDLGTLSPTVNGALTIDLGNGNNTVDIEATVGSSVSYTGGSGLDSVTVGGVNTYALRVSLGAGADTFTYQAGTTVGSATIDFGVDADTDVYTDNGVAVTWPQTLLNLP